MVVVAILVFQASLVVLVYGAAPGINGAPGRPVNVAMTGSLAQTGLANCRYGLATLSIDQVNWVDDFGAGWYLNFSSSAPPAATTAEFVGIIAVIQNKDDDGTYLPTYTVNPP
ncbi:MAG: hypothetical protein L0331_14250, partial [Chloroflexi bacterium]|nr:hypothetical protein [Chloroflexota bacterium]MCI0647116.1 hypothetical protein [Chloroflexota bacterium]